MKNGWLAAGVCLAVAAALCGGCNSGGETASDKSGGQTAAGGTGDSGTSGGAAMSGTGGVSGTTGAYGTPGTSAGSPPGPPAASGGAGR